MGHNSSPEPENKKLGKFKNELDTITNSWRKELSEIKSKDIFESMFKKFEHLSREISNTFEGLFDNIPEMMNLPDFQISQTDENVIINAKIPGLSRDNLDVNIGEDYIKLSGKYECSNEYRGLDNNLYKAQKSCSAFFRTIALPAKVNYNQAKIEYNGDVLNISIPKVKP